MNSLQDLWETVCSMMKENSYITEAGFNVWLDRSFILDYTDGILYISVPTELHKKIVINTYHENLTKCVSEIFGSDVKISYTVNQIEERGVDLRQEETKDKPFVIGANYTFDNFVLGSGNRYAHAAAIAVAENPAVFYNPLLIYGKSGVGKTHLMFAIRNKLMHDHPDMKIEYISCENFLNLFVESMLKKTSDLLHERFRSVDVLLIDDIQFIENKDLFQVEFFNTIDTLIKLNKQLVFTSDKLPKDINNLDSRLRGRFESGLMADIKMPELETRIGIINMKSKELGIKIDDDTVYYIADSIKETRPIEGVLKQIMAYENIYKTSPSISIIQGYIKKVLDEAAPDPINVPRIISEVAHVLRIPEDDIRSKKRNAEIVFARHVSIYITSTVAKITNFQIAKEFKMDHSSVSHAIKRVEDEISVDSYKRRLVNEIKDNLNRINN